MTANGKVYEVNLPQSLLDDLEEANLSLFAWQSGTFTQFVRDFHSHYAIPLVVEQVMNISPLINSATSYESRGDRGYY